VEIAHSLPTVINSSLTMHGDEGLLLYTLDMDSDQSTQEDREIFARVYDSSSWGDRIQLTDNQVSDSNPKAVYSGWGLVHNMAAGWKYRVPGRP